MVKEAVLFFCMIKSFGECDDEGESDGREGDFGN